MIGYQSYQILRKGIEPWALQAKVKEKKVIRRAAKMQRLESLVLRADCCSKWGKRKSLTGTARPSTNATEERLIIDTNLLNADCMLVN